jgi:hypothetical protein
VIIKVAFKINYKSTISNWLVFPFTWNSSKMSPPPLFRLEYKLNGLCHFEISLETIRELNINLAFSSHIFNFFFIEVIGFNRFSGLQVNILSSWRKLFCNFFFLYEFSSTFKYFYFIKSKSHVSYFCLVWSPNRVQIPVGHRAYILIKKIIEY